MLRKIIAVLSRCDIWETLITGLFGLLAADEEAEAQERTNVQSAFWANKDNQLAAAKEARDEEAAEAKRLFSERQSRVTQWQNMVNSSTALKDRYARLFARAA